MYIPSALGEEVVLPVDMNHAVLEDTLPLILYTCDLEVSLAGGVEGERCNANLIVSTKHDVCVSSATLDALLLIV